VYRNKHWQRVLKFKQAETQTHKTIERIQVLLRQIAKETLKNTQTHQMVAPIGFSRLIS